MEQKFTHPQDMLSPEFQEKKRPVFLTVLCILGFVGCAIGLVYFLYLAYGSVVMSNLSASSSRQNGGRGAWLIIIFLTCVASELVSLWALILVLRLRKTGLFLYLISEVISLIMLVASTVVFPPVTSYSPFGDNAVFVYVATLVFFDGVFIVLHLVNYKHLK